MEEEEEEKLEEKAMVRSAPDGSDKNREDINEEREGGPSAILPYPHCIFKNMQSEDVFVQNSDLATLGRRTGAIETLVGQLREAAEATNLPQDEGKGNDFIQSLMSIQFIAQKTVE